MATAPDDLSIGLRRVMRHWATGVAIVTTRDGDELCGMTCNSFTSVSMSPPTILVCIHRRTRTHALIATTGWFAVSVLAQEHEGWADRFAGVLGDLHDRFDDVAHVLSPSGAPWIANALGHVECRVVAAHEGGTHTIYLAHVTAATPAEDDEPPLLRFRSRYTTLT